MKKRAESFFGLHFDFHAEPESCPDPIGNTLKEEDIREICRYIRPDFIQVDCKGHPGWTSYPSKLGNAMPEFTGDPLKVWRKVTKEEDVALYMHYSGVIDNKYCREHPEEACTKADGKKGNDTRTCGKYVDDLLIPQLTELATEYGVNGAWVDGECWGTNPDFSPETVKLFEKTTGIDLGGKLPANRGDKYFDEYREFCRELFRKYLRHYVDAVHKVSPDFQIASNWAFTDHMPEPVCADVDFISGDFNPENSFNSARYAGRAIARLGKTWDLMSWNFRRETMGPKTPVQMMQEAASVISLGGGYQNYITQYRDGSPRMEQIRNMKSVSDFVRARQDHCFRGKAAPGAMVLMSTYDRLKESNSLYSRNGWEKIMGITALLCDTGYSNGITAEDILYGHAGEYPVIIIPELYSGLEEKTVKTLLDYAENGGSLLLSGINTCKLFAKYTDAFSTGKEVRERHVFSLNEKDYGTLNSCLEIKTKGKVFAEFSKDARAEKYPLASSVPFGKGKLGFIGADLGSAYLSLAQYLHRELLAAVLSELYTPAVLLKKCEGFLEINDLYKDGKEMIQLVNGNGFHSAPNCATENFILPCRDAVISISSASKPEKIILRPAGKELPFTYENGRAEVTVGRVDFHEIIEIVR